MNSQQLRKINELVAEYYCLREVLTNPSHTVRVESYGENCYGSKANECGYDLEWNDVKPILEKKYDKLNAELKALGYDDD